MRVKRGQLIAFEGIDGCGKTTQLARLAAVAEASGLEPLETREPTDGPFGQRIRAMARSDRRVAPEQELQWFVEDRRTHVAEVIAPALAAGRLVLSDRYYLSSVAYQGARGLDWRKILADSEAEFPAPDLALILRVAPEQGLERVQARGSAAEPAFEELDFLRRVASTFDAIERDYIARANGDDAADRVHERVLSVLQEHLGLRL
jgi:dTMP kinase